MQIMQENVNKPNLKNRELPVAHEKHCIEVRLEDEV